MSEYSSIASSGSVTTLFRVFDLFDVLLDCPVPVVDRWSPSFKSWDFVVACPLMLVSKSELSLLEKNA